MKPIPFRFRWLGAVALAFVGLVALNLLIWGATSSARQEIDDLAVSNADKRVWPMVEIETNVRRLKQTLLNFDPTNAENLQRLRDDFARLDEILTHVASAEEFVEIKASPMVAHALRNLDIQVKAIKPILNGTDQLILLKLPELVEKSFALVDAAESLSLASLRAITEISQERRDGLSAALLDLALIIVLLVLVLFVSVIVLLLSIRSGANRTREIAVTRNRLNAIVGTSLDGIIVADQAGTIIDFNGAATRIFGCDPEQAIGRDLADLIIPEHLREAHRAGMNRYAETRKKRVVDQGLVQLEAMNKDGEIFPVELSISTTQIEDGEIFVAYVRDISRRVAAQAELVEARDKAVAGEKAKANLLAVMSHEMRTPLNGLIGSLQLLEGTELSERQKKFVDVMNTSGQMLIEHVNNVLDISRVDAGKVEKFEQDFAIPDMVQEVVESLKPMAADRGNAVSFEILTDNVADAFGDKARMTQILVNLVGNALKFTKNGRVKIEVERETHSDVVEFRVIDNGIGIPEKQRSQIFEDFVTLDMSYTRAVEGTGLGLGIVRRLVSILNGEIGVESEVGEGSVFWVRVPLKRSVSAQQMRRSSGKTDLPSTSQKTHAILIVEDNEINRLVAREMLAGMGCVTTEAVDGQEGVEFANSRPFDLIFCDISMPNMDGIKATQLIRAGDGPNARTPIIALTAHAMLEDVAKFRAAGMDDVIVKPLSKARIQAVLETYLNSSSIHADESDLPSILGQEKANAVLSQANDEIQACLNQLQTLVIDGAAPKLIREKAHKISGVAAVVGWRDVHRAMSAIEDGAFDLPSVKLEALIETARKHVETITAKG